MVQIVSLAYQCSFMKKSLQEVIDRPFNTEASSDDISCPFNSGKCMHRCPNIHFTTVLQPQACFSLVPNFLLTFRLLVLYNCSYKIECISATTQFLLHGKPLNLLLKSASNALKYNAMYIISW